MNSITFSASGTANVAKLLAEGKLTPGFHAGTASARTDGSQAQTAGVSTTFQNLIQTLDAGKSSDKQPLASAQELNYHNRDARNAGGQPIGSFINIQA